MPTLDNYWVTDDEIEMAARTIANNITSAARENPGPVVWITGNHYMPPLRSITEAEYIWQSRTNDDGEAFAWLVERMEEHLRRANVALECPDYDNALYAVDLNRWSYKEHDAEHHADYYESFDLTDEWEPVAKGN